MAAPKPATPVIVTAAERLAARPPEVDTAEVTPKVTAAPADQVVAPRPLTGIAPRPLFQTVVEPDPEPVKVRALNAKTLAEHAAGVEAISQYV